MFEDLIYTKHARDRMRERGIVTPLKLKRVTKAMIRSESTLRNKPRRGRSKSRGGKFYYDVENPKNVFCVAVHEQSERLIVITAWIM